KLRLFSVGCCRHIWHLLHDPRCRHAVEVAEEIADGLASPLEQAAAQQAAAGAARDLVRAEANAALYSVQDVAKGYGIAETVGALVRSRVKDVSRHLLRREAAAREARAEVANLLRDLAGNPFRPIAVDPSWQTSTVTALARVIYTERNFEGLPVLADA